MSLGRGAEVEELGERLGQGRGAEAQVAGEKVGQRERGGVRGEGEGGLLVFPFSGLPDAGCHTWSPLAFEAVRWAPGCCQVKTPLCLAPPQGCAQNQLGSRDTAAGSWGLGRLEMSVFHVLRPALPQSCWWRGWNGASRCGGRTGALGGPQAVVNYSVKLMQGQVVPLAG